MIEIDPTENKDRHCKVYVEESLFNAIKQFQLNNGIYSFSEAGRRLWLKALEQYGYEKRKGEHLKLKAKPNVN